VRLFRVIGIPKAEYYRSLKKELAPIFAADFDRIVPCHGDIVEQGGMDIFIKVYSIYA
jgi:hypothetical protein